MFADDEVYGGKGRVLARLGAERAVLSRTRAKHSVARAEVRRDSCLRPRPSIQHDIPSYSGHWSTQGMDNV